MAAATKLLLSQARRHCLTKPTSQIHSSCSSSSPSPFPLFPRSLSSNPNPNPNPIPNPLPTDSPKRESVPIQPVSYPIKPKDPTPSTNKIESENPSPQFTQSPPQQNQEFLQKRPREFTTSWTREDVRYVKDVPSISPVSYPTRVAPLPEDRVTIGGEEESVGTTDEAAVAGEEMERERRVIEERRKRLIRIVEDVEVEEEKKVVPFPRLIKPIKKEKKAIFDLMDAIRQVKASARKTFDETLEAHVRLGIDPSRSDLIVRGTLTLPHGVKKVLKVAIFAEGADADEARAAGAEVVGGVELIDEIASTGKIDFDKCYTTRQLYPRVAKIARILNRHGLMPDAKQGTVVSDVTRAVKESKKNQIKFRMDKTAIVHVGLGKVSFTAEYLRENIGAFMNSLLLAKPAGLKKTSKYAGYVDSFHICSTMGPGFPVSIQSLSKAVDHYNKVHLT